MKKLFLIQTMTLFSIMSIISCKKEHPINVTSTIQNQIVTVKNDLLIFSSTEAYRSLVDNSSADQMNAIMDEIKTMDNFTSFFEYYSIKNPSILSDSASINNEFLQTILNKDAAVQIGDYI